MFLTVSHLLEWFHTGIFKLVCLNLGELTLQLSDKSSVFGVSPCIFQVCMVRGDT